MLELLALEGFAVVLEAMDVRQAADVDLLGGVGLVAGLFAVDVVKVVVEDEEGKVLLFIGGGFGVLDEGLGELGGGELGVGLLGGETKACGQKEQEGGTAKEGTCSDGSPRTADVVMEGV